MREKLRGLDFRTSKHIMGNKKPESREVNKIQPRKNPFTETPGCSPTTRRRHIDPIKMIFYCSRSIRSWPDTFSVAAKTLFSKQRFWQLAPRAVFARRRMSCYKAAASWREFVWQLLSNDFSLKLTVTIFPLGFGLRPSLSS